MSAEHNNSPLVEQFWSQFVGEHRDLRAAVMGGNTLGAYQRIGELLVQAHFPHVYEVTSDAEDAILVFSPESDEGLARTIDSFVRAAPPTPGWKIFGRRQQRPVEDALAMLEEVYGVQVEDVSFALRPVPGGFDLTMYSELADVLGEPEKEGFVSFFLEHALGEDVSMRIVKKRRIEPPPETVSNALTAQGLVDALSSSGEGSSVG